MSGLFIKKYKEPAPFSFSLHPKGTKKQKKKKKERRKTICQSQIEQWLPTQ
jgi:hypothetical protein